MTSYYYLYLDHVHTSLPVQQAAFMYIFIMFLTPHLSLSSFPIIWHVKGVIQAVADNRYNRGIL